MTEDKIQQIDPRRTIDCLADHARKKKFPTCAQIMEFHRIDFQTETSPLIYKHLRDVAQICFGDGTPLLNCIVTTRKLASQAVSNEQPQPYAFFYRHARELGLLFNDEVKFLREQRAEVWQHFRPATRNTEEDSLTLSQILPLDAAAASEERDAIDPELGTRGELWVVDQEKRRLRERGRMDLADRVDHVAARGPQEGYDVRSFADDGSELLIEVKTTRLGLEADFFMTERECQFGLRNKGRYRIYRVYEFDIAPRFQVYGYPSANWELHAYAHRVKFKQK